MAGPPTSALTNTLREAGVVIFSILLALAVDAWWDGRQEAKQANVVAAAVEEEMLVNATSLTESVERHRAIAEAIREAWAAGTSERVHGPAVLAREIWEPRTPALEAFLSLQSRSTLADPDLRIQLGTVVELLRKYRERELRAAEFQDRARERIADIGLPIQDSIARRPIYSDQVMLNYLALRQIEEVAAIQAAGPLAAGIQEALEALAALSGR
jgi:hypothetical protein